MTEFTNNRGKVRGACCVVVLLIVLATRPFLAIRLILEVIEIKASDTRRDYKAPTFAHKVRQPREFFQRHQPSAKLWFQRMTVIDAGLACRDPAVAPERFGRDVTHDPI